jgi:deoxycytidylate deaminase
MAEQLVAAYGVATASPDPSTQNGALACTAHGALVGEAPNDFPPGIDATPERLDRPLKYAYIEHAERGAIYNAARHGHRTHVLVCPWAACADCARAIVLAGVRILVRHQREDATGRWGDSIAVGDEILTAGGVTVVDVTDPLPQAPAIRFAGSVWQP